MALDAFPHEDALVSLPYAHSDFPLSVRIQLAADAVEAAQQVWAMRARDLESMPSERAFRLAKWAGLALKDATDEHERLLAHLRAELAL